MSDFDIDDIERRMQKAVEAFRTASRGAAEEARAPARYSPPEV